MLFKALLLSLFTAGAIAASCKDDDYFTWINNWQGTEYELSCAFLTNANDEAQNEKRQKNWCSQKVRGYYVQDKCKKSCDNCDGDNDKHNDDQHNDDYCVDKPKKWEDSEGRGCKWYSKNDKRCKDAKDYKYDGTDAKKACCACGGGKVNSDLLKIDVSKPEDDDEDECKDKPKHFEDSEGRGCKWYSKHEKECKHAKEYENEDGEHAKKACCACGGGKDYYSDLFNVDVTGHHDDDEDEDDDEDDDESCEDKYGWWEDSEGNDCDWYAKKDKKCRHADKYENDGYDAEDVCCACGGGKSPDDDDFDGCQDKPKKFEDSEGKNCEWYAKKDTRCKDAEDYENDDGYTAKDACCACGGGKDKYFKKLTEQLASAAKTA